LHTVPEVSQILCEATSRPETDSVSSRRPRRPVPTVEIY
jgi:hypothetical protein